MADITQGLYNNDPANRLRDGSLYEEQQKQTTNIVASNLAYMDSVWMGQPGEFNKKLEEHKAATNLFDEITPLIQDEYSAGRITDTGMLSGDLSPAELAANIQHLAGLVDPRPYTARLSALISAVQKGHGSTPSGHFDQWYYTQNATEKDIVQDALVHQQRYRMFDALDEIMENEQFESVGDAVTEVLFTDLPVLSSIQRGGLTKIMLEIAGEPGFGTGLFGVLTGEQKQRLRGVISDASPEELQRHMKGFADELESWRDDPLASQVLTSYLLREQMETILTPEVRAGESAKNTSDRIITHFFEALDLLIVGSILKSFGARSAGFKMGIRFGDTADMRKVLRISDQTASAKVWDDTMRNAQTAESFGTTPGKTASSGLPKPTRFVKDADELPDGTKEVFHRSERTRQKILDITDDLTGKGLNPVDKSRVQYKAIASLDIFDGYGFTHAAMSGIKEFPNGTGFEVTQTIGKTANGGWTSLKEASDSLLQVDANGEIFKVMRVDENGLLKPVFKNNKEFLDFVFKGKLPKLAPNMPGVSQQFYIQGKRDQFYHFVDKETFGVGAIQSTGGNIHHVLFPPNIKFGPEIYNNFLETYMTQQTVVQRFDNLFKPFYDLGVADTRFVSEAFEWMEDFGKQNGRAPTYADTFSHYSGITEKQMNGIVALRTGLDTMHDLFNRKLYREYNALGFKSAYPVDPGLPTFHGLARTREEAKAGSYLDPVSGNMVTFSTRELDDLYNSGGSVMELEFAIATNDAKHRASRILLPVEAYTVNKLSLSPLIYHPGYSLRFPKDPHFIVQMQSGVKVNGLDVKSKRVYEEAVRTSDTMHNAEGYLARFATKNEDGVWVRNSDPSISYKITRAHDISQSEGSLLQKQAIQKEGRMFWDTRNFDRLPDVYDNPTQLRDIATSLEKGVAMLSRQIAVEDLIESTKGAWNNTYGHLLKETNIQTSPRKAVLEELVAQKRNTTNKELRKKLNEAIDLVRYMSMIEGTASAIVPVIRDLAITVASTVSRGRTPITLENYFQTMDPIRNMTSVAFRVYMTLRPGRQALMQSAQISFLAPLDPIYVGSMKIFIDAIGLRRGLSKLRKSSWNDGWSDSKVALAMGYSKKDYRILVQALDDSGIMELVDVHSFAGGARRASKVAAPESDAGMVGYKAKQLGVALLDWSQRVGFDWGERNNMTFTWMIAVRRALKAKGLKSVSQFSKADWSDIRVDASNLGLGMVKPNNLPYQVGVSSIGTQFISFGHKATLSMLSLNPSITKIQAAKIVLGTYLLWGANMYGARDYVQEQLVQMGIDPDLQIPGIDNATVLDLMSAGIIETTFNKLGRDTIDEFKDIDMGFLAPGLDFTRMWDMQIGVLFDQPWRVAFGAFGNIFSKTLKSFDFAMAYKRGDPDATSESKFIVGADAMMRGILPQYSDAVRAYLGYQMGVWVNSSASPMPLETTMEGLIARGIFGVHTREEVQWTRLTNAIWENKDEIEGIIRANQKHMKEYINRWRDGEITDSVLREQLVILHNWFESFPEGAQTYILEKSFMGDIKDLDETVAGVFIKAVEERHVDYDMIALIATMDITSEQKKYLVDMSKANLEDLRKMDASVKEDTAKLIEGLK